MIGQVLGSGAFRQLKKGPKTFWCINSLSSLLRFLSGLLLLEVLLVEHALHLVWSGSTLDANYMGKTYDSVFRTDE